MPVVVVKYTPLQARMKKRLAKDLTDIVAGQLKRDPKDITVCFEETSLENFAQGGVIAPPVEDRLMRVNIEWYDNKAQDVTDTIVRMITNKLHEVTGAPLDKIETAINLLAGNVPAAVPYYKAGEREVLPVTHVHKAELSKIGADTPLSSQGYSRLTS